MADQRVVNVAGQPPQYFPADATDAEISAALNAIPAANAPHAPKARTWADSAALAGSAVAKAIPGAADLAADVATNPNVPRAMASAGRVIGGIAAPVGGALEGGPIGALAGVAAAAKGAWAGGKTGWFTGKLAQSIAAPIADIMEKTVPYAQALSTLSGAQGVNDLAQMSDPKRSDIGVMGAGTSDTQAATQATMMGAQIKALVSQGVSPAEASRTVSNAWTKFLSEQRK